MACNQIPQWDRNIIKTTEVRSAPVKQQPARKCESPAGSRQVDENRGKKAGALSKKGNQLESDKAVNDSTEQTDHLRQARNIIAIAT